MEQIEDLQLNYSHQPNIHIEAANNEDLRRTAGEILNGVRRNVEVQILNQPVNNNFQAFTVLESGKFYSRNRFTHYHC